MKRQFVVDSSLDQRFILDNPFIDTSTIKVYVKGESESGLGSEYKLINNIKQVTGTSRSLFNSRDSGRKVSTYYLVMD